MQNRSQSSLATRLKRLRVERGLSQRELAAPLLTASYLSLIEAGKRQPSEEVLAHLAQRLGVDVDDLRSGRSAALEAQLELRLQEARRALHQGIRDEGERMAEGIRETADAEGLDRVAARALCVLGVAAEHQDLPALALERYEAAEALWRDDPAHLRYEAVVGVARAHLALGDPRLSIHLLHDYLDELQRKGYTDPIAQMRAHGALVACYLTVGLRSKGAREAQMALELAPMVDDPAQLACLHMNVGGALLQQGRHADAIEAARKAEHYFSMLDWHLGAAWAEMNRGIMLLEKNDLDPARTAFERALEKLDGVADSELDRANVLNELAQVERLSGRRARAEARLNEARALVGPEGPPLVLATNRREMGRTIANKDPAKAESEMRLAIGLFRAGKAHRDVATTAQELAQMLRSRRKSSEALRVLEQGLEAALLAD